MPKIKIGYKLCGEEQSPQELIGCARRAEEVVCGPDQERYIARINEYVEAGYGHV